MVKNRVAMLSLETAIDTFLAEYASRRHRYAEFPKFGIDGIFGLWDIYLAFLEKHEGEEQAARQARREITGHDVQIVGVDGGFPKRIREAVNPWYEQFREAMEQILREGYTTKGDIPELTSTAFGDNSLFAFFIHDINHILADLTRQFWIATLANHDFSVSMMKNHKDQVRRFLELYNRNPEFLFGAYIEPYKMLRFMAETELGEPHKKETFKPADLAWKVAFVLQNRYPQGQYSLATTISNSKENEVVVDAENFDLNGNSGVVFSIIYNLMKNAYKKFDDEPDSSHKIFAQAYEALFSSYVITVGDSGTPIDLNVMKEKVRKLIAEEGIDSIVMPTQRLRSRLKGWQQSEYKVGELTVRDMTDIAFMSRMSGFDNQDGFSSGMGLYGIKYLVERMGGRILYGEDFETGGPLFTVVLPKKLPSSGMQRVLNLAATGINQRCMYQLGNQRKAA